MDTSDQREPSDPTLTAGSPDVGESPMSEVEPGSSERRRRLTWPAIPWARVARLTAMAGIVVVVVVVASVGLGAAAFVAVGFYGDYGAVKNEPNARAWAALEPRFAGAATCASCHAAEVDAQDASTHVDVSCESCHGPAGDHAVSDAMAKATELEVPTSKPCITCHSDTRGRPASFPQVDPSRHYRGGVCLRCHDPHSIVAVRPPVVSHPLERLPECIACHAPDGLKEIPSGHEPAADSICLSCHGRNAVGLPD